MAVTCVELILFKPSAQYYWKKLAERKMKNYICLFETGEDTTADSVLAKFDEISNVNEYGYHYASRTSRLLNNF